MNLTEVTQQVLDHLDREGLLVIHVEGKIIELEQNYRIEIENEQLFKLSHEGYVVAPFGKLDTLCHFIKEDMEG
ncbi:MAG: hypothetical protein MRY78_19290 [Saprospiraceae bacterium]|nr:hypothetical protein [Saprospiraceae bacterium]